IIAGIIQHAAYFKERVEPFIDGDQVVFLGHAGPEKRKELLGNAIALLHPIYFNEPFGLSVAESMCCGTPVIAYNRGSMPELIENGISGFLVNDLEEAVDAVNIVQKINRRKCYEYATVKFSYDVMIDKYIKAYESILKR
ncbi:MAG TPA: glycosyltransferase, partial [Chitinophagaceae bacterium]|nr:glycosyltransferase [Chitinophagaceae bacterium]